MIGGAHQEAEVESFQRGFKAEHGLVGEAGFGCRGLGVCRSSGELLVRLALQPADLLQRCLP